jgi:hypothetical protein
LFRNLLATEPNEATIAPLLPQQIEYPPSRLTPRAAADVHATQFHAIRKKDDLSSAERF